MRTFIVSTLLLVTACCSDIFGQNAPGKVIVRGFPQVNKTKGTPTFGNTPDYLRKIDVPVFNVAPKPNVANHAPDNNKRPNTDSILMRCDVEGKKDTILTVARSVSFIDQHAIKSMEILKGNTAVNRYGIIAEKGIILMTLIQGTELLTINQLFDKYEIAKKDRQLPLYVDAAPAMLPPAVIYSAANIISVKKMKAKDDKTIILNMETAK